MSVSQVGNCYTPPPVEPLVTHEPAVNDEPAFNNAVKNAQNGGAVNTQNEDAAADTASADAPEKAPANDAVADTQSSGSVQLYGGGPNSVELSNTTDKPMTLEFRGNLTEGSSPEERANSVQYVELAPGETKTIELPEEWGGNVRKFVEGNDSANLAEFTFAGGQLWYDESVETGRNASILMQTPDGQTAGSASSIMGNAPEGSYTLDADGNKVLLPSKTNDGAFSHLTEQIGSDNAYIHSEDHTALRSMVTNKLTISFGEA